MQDRVSVDVLMRVHRAMAESRWIAIAHTAKSRTCSPLHWEKYLHVLLASWASWVGVNAHVLRPVECYRSHNGSKSKFRTRCWMWHRDVWTACAQLQAMNGLQIHSSGCRRSMCHRRTSTAAEGWRCNTRVQPASNLIDRDIPSLSFKGRVSENQKSYSSESGYEIRLRVPSVKH